MYCYSSTYKMYLYVKDLISYHSNPIIALKMVEISPNKKSLVSIDESFNILIWDDEFFRIEY